MQLAVHGGFGAVPVVETARRRRPPGRRGRLPPGTPVPANGRAPWRRPGPAARYCRGRRVPPSWRWRLRRPPTAPRRGSGPAGRASPPTGGRRWRSPARARAGCGRRRSRRWRRAPGHSAPGHGRGSRSPGSSRPSPGRCRRPRPDAPRPAGTGAPTGAPHRILQQHFRALRIARRADQEQVPLPGRNPGAGDAHRVRSRRSSPMKVRDEPTTPCTMEILPASRLESCARNRVGRRSLISRSFSSAAGSARGGQRRQDRLVHRRISLATASGDDHVGARQQRRRRP